MRVSIENPTGLSTGALYIDVDGVPWNDGPIPFPPAGAERVVRARIQPIPDVRSAPSEAPDR
jgi:hypothetical protein